MKIQSYKIKQRLRLRRKPKTQQNGRKNGLRPTGASQKNAEKTNPRVVKPLKIEEITASAKTRRKPEIQMNSKVVEITSFGSYQTRKSEQTGFGQKERV